MRVTRGRTSLTAIIAGLPVVVLSTTGARSDRRRSTSLMGIPVWDRIADIAALIYPPSTGYVERAGERGIRVYVLDPLPQTDRGRRQS